MYCKPLHPKTPPMLPVPRLGPLGNGVYWGGMMRLLHQATYHPCPTGQRCNTDKPRCANCQGEHNSWTHACPAAKAAFELQAQKEEYATGKFESYTPFTFADTDYTLGKSYEGHPRISTPPPSHLQINFIPATSPFTPTAPDA